MFNFFRSQGKAVKYLLGFIMALVGLSMLLYLVPNYDSSTTSANPVLLEVGSTKLLANDAMATFQQETQGRIPADMLRIYFPQFISERTMLLAALEEAKRLGIDTSDQEVVATLAQSPGFAPYFENGKLVKRQEFEAALAQQGITIDKVFEELKSQATLTKLRDVILENTIITPKEVEDEYKRKYERATVDYIGLNEAGMRGKVNVSEDEVRKTWEAEKASYNQPEKYTFRVLVLSQDKVSETMTVSEKELRDAYAGAVDNFRTPEQVHARHILVSTADKSDADKKSLLAKAEDLAKQAKTGNFIELAKKNSDDTGNAPNGGDLGTFSRGAMDAAFENAAFALKSGEVSGVVTTQYGYHIIKVDEKIPSKVTPFETVRADLERELRNSKLGDAMQTTSSQMRADLVKTPADAAAVSKKYGAELVVMTDSARGAAIPTIGVTPELDAVLPALKEGGVSELLALPGDRAAVAVLDKKIPARPSTFDEAKAEVREKLIGTQARTMLATLSKEVTDRVKRGEDMKTVGQSLGLKVETASDFGVTENLPGIGPASYFQQAFTSPAGTVIGPVLLPGTTVIAKGVGKKEADMSTFAAERKDLLLGLKSARAQQTNTLWMDSIVEKMRADGDLKVYNDEVQRVTALLR